MATNCSRLADSLESRDQPMCDTEVSEMFAPANNGWHVEPSRERVSDEVMRYVRSEFKENDAGWLLAGKESPH
jgi:hypothetical protein